MFLNGNTATKWIQALAIDSDAYMPTVTALPYLFRKIMKINSAFWKYWWPLKSSGFCHSWKTTTTNTAFSIFPESSRNICAGTYRSHFWTHCTWAKENNADLLSEVLCTCVKDTKQKKFLGSFHKAASREDRNQGAFFFKRFMYNRKYGWVLIVHLQNHLQQKWDVSKHFRKYTMRSGLLPPLTRKMTLAWTLKFAVVLWNDWTGGQSSVIGKQRSQLRGISKGGAQCRLPCDFPIKSGSWIYLINVGICLLMCSGKSCFVLDFGDFSSWKCNFGVGKYADVFC